MTVTDKIIFFAAIVLFWRGWTKGILRTIFGPIALIVCSVLSYFYYIFTRDLMAAAAIGIIAPIVLTILFSILLNLLSAGKEKPGVSPISRIIAGAMNLVWGEFILVVVILTVWMIPLDIPPLVKAKADIEKSSVFALAKPKMDAAMKEHNVQPIDPAKISAMSNPEALKDIEKSNEYQELINDPRIQELITDPQITEQIENKQLAQLMQNPKFIELTRDPELLKKFIALYSKMVGQTPPSP